MGLRPAASAGVFFLLIPLVFFAVFVTFIVSNHPKKTAKKTRPAETGRQKKRSRRDAPKNDKPDLRPVRGTQTTATTEPDRPRQPRPKQPADKAHAQASYAVCRFDRENGFSVMFRPTFSRYSVPFCRYVFAFSTAFRHSLPCCLMTRNCCAFADVLHSRFSCSRVLLLCVRCDAVFCRCAFDAFNYVTPCAHGI